MSINTRKINYGAQKNRAVTKNEWEWREVAEFKGMLLPRLRLIAALPLIGFHIGFHHLVHPPTQSNCIGFHFISSWCQKAALPPSGLVGHRVASGSEWVSGRPSVAVHRQTVKSWPKILRGSLRGIRSDLQIRLWTSNAWLVRLGGGASEILLPRLNSTTSDVILPVSGMN